MSDIALVLAHSIEVDVSQAFAWDFRTEHVELEASERPSSAISALR
jgi:hypothetical protein